jgi:AcrR family transcriptional regulator
MARPINAKPEQTKRNILWAASQLFANHGFDGTSVRKIATSAGVSLGMIRHYYGSKEGLYRACIASAYSIYQQIGVEIRDGIDSGGAPGEVLARAARRGFQFALANQPAFKLVLWTLMESETWRTELGDENMLPFIVETARAVAAPLRAPVGVVGLRIRTMVFLVVRYATADLNEIAYLLRGGDLSAGSDEEVVQAVEDHLAELTLLLFR